MEELRNIKAKVENILSERGISKYSVSISESEKREFNADNGSFSLFRTLFDNNIVLNVFNGTKNGLCAGNDFTDEGIADIVESSIATCQASPEDDANDIAPDQGRQVIRQGSYEPDLELFFSRVKELSDTLTNEYPKIKVMLLVAQHTKIHSIYSNTNGTDFERFAGSYSVQVEFSAADGTKATGMDAFGFDTEDLSTPFLDQANSRARIESCIEQLNVVTIPEKFTGSVIFTPDCLASVISATFSNYVSDAVILDGTSLWIDKIGKKVADERINITLSSTDERLVCPSVVTSDGFKCEDVKIIENGILNSFIISLYCSKKTGKPVTKANSRTIVMKNGDEKLEDMIKNIKQGLLVGGFSGGHPQTNGEFSGVAKNSFYIENGQIQGAVMETMINGNLGDMFTNVEGISKETVCDGNSVLPYLSVSGIVVSGK